LRFFQTLDSNIREKVGHSYISCENTAILMLIFKKVADIRRWSARQNSPVGFAPTMGALHDGHLELIRMAKRDGCMAVASIFVNPTQFNDPRDLEKYPRTPEKDMALLLSAHCDALFIPSVEEVYPPGEKMEISLDFGALDQVMEGVFRPGHFKGMATVVHRLLDIVQPQRLYMGQKDFQQLSIVRDMIRQLALPIQLVMCPTVREADGVAMSSRNVRLSPEMRRIAPVIHQTLQTAKTAFADGVPPEKIQADALLVLQTAGLRPEYFDIVDGVTLLPVQAGQKGGFVVACTAAFAGEVRLIDNLVLAE
jgi:pantoate--beta-alanine ligase